MESSACAEHRLDSKTHGLAGRILQAQSGADGSYTFSRLESTPEGTLQVRRCSKRPLGTTVTNVVVCALPRTVPSGSSRAEAAGSEAEGFGVRVLCSCNAGIQDRARNLVRHVVRWKPAAALGRHGRPRDERWSGAPSTIAVAVSSHGGTGIVTTFRTPTAAGVVDVAAIRLQIRVVLSWGADPRDLDVRLLTPRGASFS